MPNVNLAARVAALTVPNAVNYAPGSLANNPGQGIQTGTGADWFGPLPPLAPLASPQVAGRRMDYPPGYNLVTQPRAYEPIGFADLRALADADGITRAIIETRKDQMSRLDWNVRAREAENDAEALSSGRIKTIEAFLHKPDGTRYWDAWLRDLLEDMFVIDAPALWCERTRDGKLIHLHPIDGATIKRVIDDWGRTPQPPLPAYQQVLHGLPAVDYTTRDIIYRPRNLRSSRVYGFSPVEQIIMTVNIAIRRETFLLQYYTEGNIPDALIGTPDDWTTQEIERFQIYWDSLNAGNTAERRRGRFVPGGVAKTFIQTKEPELTGMMDEWLARIRCFAFSISPQPFIKMVNRGNQESMQEAALSEGMAPIQAWVKSLVDDIIADEFDESGLEFRWKTDKELDPAIEAANGKVLVSTGIKTVNEVRADLGMDPLPGGDELVFLTATGPIPVDAEARQAQAEAMRLPAPAPPEPDQDGARPAPEATPDASGPKTAPPATGAKPKPKAAPKAPEVGKAAAAPFAKAHDANDPNQQDQDQPQTLTPLPADNPALTKRQATLAAAIFGVFKRTGSVTADQVERILQRQALAIAPDDATREAIASQVADGLDFTNWSAIVPHADAAIGAVGQDAAEHVIEQLRLGADDREAMVNQVFEDALDYARGRAAEFVGMQWNAAGELVANPNAAMAITESTRHKIHDLVVRALSPAEPGALQPTLAEAIAAMKDDISGGTLFSRGRAELIARAEVAMAHGHGTLAGFRAAEALGLTLEKRNMTAEDGHVCPICIGNTLAGWIPLATPFPSGQMTFPFHVNCRDTIVARQKPGATT